MGKKWSTAAEQGAAPKQRTTLVGFKGYLHPVSASLLELLVTAGLRLKGEQ